MDIPDSTEKRGFWLAAWVLLAIQNSLICILVKRALDRPDSPPIDTQALADVCKAACATSQALPEETESPESRAVREAPKTVLNWDVLGIAAATVSLGGAAIFFFAGWIYQHTFYGYLGIDPASVQTLPWTTMADGAGPVFIIIVGIGGAWFLFGVLRYQFSSRRGLQPRDIYAFAAITLILVLGIYALFYSQLINQTSAIELTDLKGNARGAFGYGALFTFLCLGVAVLASRSRQSRNEGNSVVDTSRASTTDDFAVLHTWPFSLGVMTLVLFTILLLLIPLMGYVELNRRGQGVGSVGPTRLLHAFSDEPITLLEEHELAIRPHGYEYGPFDLVASNDFTYYLVKWHEPAADGTASKPSLYLLPRTDPPNVYLFTPTATPTPSPMPAP
jgi:hypothetical protein